MGVCKHGMIRSARKGRLCMCPLAQVSGNSKVSLAAYNDYFWSIVIFIITFFSEMWTMACHGTSVFIHIYVYGGW